MKSLALATAATALVLSTSAANATVVAFDNIRATWQDVLPPGVVNLNFTDNGTGHPSVHWGVPLTVDGQSGYALAAALPQPVNINIPPSPSGDFVLGTFVHENHIIQVGFPNSSITGIQLALTTDVTIGGVDQGDRTFLFNFSHEETPNSADPCAHGGANGQGVNINGCADRVTVTPDAATATFLIGGDEYTVNVKGFTVNGVFTDEFLTIEDQHNEAQLIADVRVTHPSRAHEPAAMGILGLGLIGAGVVSRRRRQ